MWEIILRCFEVLFVLVGAIGGLYCGRLWIQVQKHRAIAEGKDELIKTMTAGAEAWQSLADAKTKELAKYRDEQHAKGEKDNNTILRLTGENADLRAKTDISPLVSMLTDLVKSQRKFTEEQTTINEKLFVVLEALGKRIEHAKPSRRLRVR